MAAAGGGPYVALAPLPFRLKRHQPTYMCANMSVSGHPARSSSARWGRKPSHRIPARRSEEHTSELQSLMRISYAVFCLKKKNNKTIGLHYTVNPLNLSHQVDIRLHCTYRVEHK